MRNLYLSRAVLASFEGEGGAVSGDGRLVRRPGLVRALARRGAGAGAGAGAGDARFTQDDFNRKLAEDKRKRRHRFSGSRRHLRKRQRPEPDHPRPEPVGPATGEPAEGDADEGTELAHNKKQLEEQFPKRIADKKKAAKSGRIAIVRAPLNRRCRTPRQAMRSTPAPGRCRSSAQ